VQEGLEIALEADLLHHRVHLPANARHFGKADLVDFLRALVEGDELVDLRAVIGLPIGQGISGQRLAGALLVFAAHEGQQPRMGRDDIFGDRLAGLRAQGFLIGSRDRGGQVLKGS
jgi:hypothetical protein